MVFTTIRPAAAALAAGFALAACSGGTMGSVGSLPAGSGETSQTVADAADALMARRTGSQDAAAAISAANALGGRVRQLQLAGLDDAWSGMGLIAATHARACRDGIELLAPDRNGDPNSTEALFFYDPLCRQLAVDDVRLYNSTGANGETVAHTDSFYPPKTASAFAVATSTSTIANATFGNYGVPDAAAGFNDVTTGQVSVGKTPVLSAAGELVMMPGSHRSQSFCGDSAGFGPTGIASLDATFGWQGGMLSGGSRTSSGNGFVTWSATPSGTIFRGAIGSLSIASATHNVSCPIATPDFTIDGGTPIGTYSIPISMTFHRGMLWSVTIRHAVLPNGDTLTVQTERGRRQRGRATIDGSIASGHTPVATFAVNAFGNGTLTITSTGAQYKIVDWIVVQ